jgi:uncharacterized protein with HEPN domain
VKNDGPYLHHVLDALAQLETYAREGRARFLADRMLQEAVIRNFEVLGEAVKNLSAQTKASHPEVPWKSVAGLRDKLIHEYFGVNKALLWDVLDSEVPALRKSIAAIIANLS